MLGLQRIEVAGKRFVLLEEPVYERLCREAGEVVADDDVLPPLPKPDANGRFPAMEYTRISLARNLIRDRKSAGLSPERLATLAGITYVTDDGVADFHSLRHTFISNLVAGGVHPKLAQQLARHSTITLTMDRYSHVGLLDMNAELQSLPVTTAPESQLMRATGTTDQAAEDFSCTKSCTRPAEITPFQPSSTVSARPSDEAPEMQKTPQKHEVFAEFSEGWPSGLEPPTSGSTIRRSNQLSYDHR